MEAAGIPQKPIPEEAMQEALLKVLARGDIDDDVAHEFVKSISSYEVFRMYPGKPFPLGTIDPDGLSLRLVLDRAGVDAVSKAVFGLPQLEKWQGFPLGIIDPEWFLGQLDFRF